MMNSKLELLILLSIILLPFTVVTSASSTNSNYTSLTLQAELNASTSAGFNFTMQSFASSSASNCLLVQISRCDNNNPSQFVCINSAYYQSYSSQRQRVIKPGVCPDYVLQGTISCAVVNGYCAVVDTGGQTASNSSPSTTTPGITIPPVNVTLPPITINVSSSSSLNNATISTTTQVLVSIKNFFVGVYSLLKNMFHF